MGSDPSLCWESTFAPAPDAAWRARIGVSDLLRDEGVGSERIGEALVVLSELVTNAVRHARTDFSVLAVLESGTLRLEVFDRDTRPPALLGLDTESTSGRGLHIVAGVASDWGWQAAEGPGGESGKRVWAELVLDAPDDSEQG